MLIAPGTAQADVPFAQHVASALDEVRRIFDDHLASPHPPVQELVRHVERYRGKMLRPALVLTAGLAAKPDSPLTREHHVVGAVVEMVHMATLVHDDVLDDADVRRRGATINRLRGNEAAVMLGDYLFATAYHLCATLPTTHAARAVARASMTLCEGELLQLHARNDLTIGEREYFDIVSRKTGELIAASAELGAVCSNAQASTRDALRRYAMHAGIAFQIQDDLLDLLASESDTGKSVARDIAMGKATLPIIHHLRVAKPERRVHTCALLELATGWDDPSCLRAQLLDALRETESLAYARDAALQHVHHAQEALRTVPESPARDHLSFMAAAAVERQS